MLLVGMGVTGCGTGQLAQTAGQVTTTNGAEGRAGSIVLRDVQIVFPGHAAGDTAYRPGQDVLLQATMINEAGAAATDRILAVSSPIAAGERIVGDDHIAPGRVLTSGYAAPQVPRTDPDTRAVAVVLTGLRAPIQAGMTYPVMFTFEHAGTVHLQVPVGNPHPTSPAR